MAERENMLTKGHDLLVEIRHRVTCPALVALGAFLLLAPAALADVAQGDSVDFTLNTTGVSPGIGGAAQGDSSDFTLNTTGVAPGVGGAAQADSLDFTLNTTGISPGIGGGAQADSADFTLDTRTKLVVTIQADSGAGSLRQAISDAPLEAVVTFAPNVVGVIALTSGELPINRSLSIIGPGANLLTVSGNNASRVFHVTSGSSLIANLRIANGHTSGGGGGIAMEGGVLDLNYCTVAGCYAAGVDVASQGGGAIAIVGASSLAIVGSTISSNTTPYYGGGLYLRNGAYAFLLNSTVSGNRTLDGSNDDAWGGGIFVQSSSVNVIACTIANNSSVTAGGAVYLVFNATGTFGNSLIAGNSAPAGPDCRGTFVSHGYNLIGNSSGGTGFDQVGDQLNVNPLIGPLADNGGPTFTHALLTGSPAIDTGKSFGLTTDQRGELRPFDFASIANSTNGDGTDIGAFEIAPVARPPGIISWWRAENNALDSIGTNHGTLINGATFAAGEVGQAFSLNGTSQSVAIPDAPSLRPASVTLEAWILFNAASGTYQILGKPLGNVYLDSYVVALDSGTLAGVVADAASLGPVLRSPFSPVLGQWYHLAYTFDDVSKQQTLYLNGAQIAFGIANKTIAYDTHPLLIGRDDSVGSPAYFFPGRIDEAAIYNRALSAMEIASIYNAGAAGKQLPVLMAPMLSIHLTPTNAVLVSWPSPSTGFTLQQSTDLSPLNWVAVTNTVNDNGVTKSIRVNPPDGNMFYRLKHP